MRSETIISAVGKADVLAEVGCDHAKLTELALERGLCGRAVVSDISAKCLEKAEKTLRRFGARVTYVVFDGVPPEAERADVILICGMGGNVMSGILSRYRGEARLVLSPQGRADLVRRALADNGYAIDRDECFEADGKFYDLIAAGKGAFSPDPMQAEFGTFWQKPTDALVKRLTVRLNKLRGGGERSAEEAERIAEVLKWRTDRT